MISDEDVCNFYQYLDIPGVYLDHPFSLQIFRGTSVYRRTGGPGKCERHHGVFQRHHIIPEFCFGCYKVLVEPRTVMELFKLLMVFEEIDLPNDNLRKCLTELREDCAGTYKGLVYSRGIEEGEQVFGLIKEAVATEISPDVPVQLKRGCSEFGAAYPEYASADPGIEPMKYDESWRPYEEDFDKDVTYVEPDSDTRGDAGSEERPVYTPAEIFAMTYWLYYAATIGDESYQPIAGGPLPPIADLKRPPFVGPPGSSSANPGDNS